ncbi:hypothetical protein WJX72_007336 [[Myrmecia] bisecta]|uniref:Uncharacterized protein n=1 Tax=[Myrmecia] bisecta TaxID=41462 RepID=A0AAW1PU20_9CHLO
MSRATGRLHELGVNEPTPVQLAAIPEVLKGGNIAIQSYTGSGKTLAYLLPVLSRAIQLAEAEFEALFKAKRVHEAGQVQAIVVVPSRELAMQIVRVAQGLLPPEAKGTVQQCIGGANPGRQADALKANKPVLVVGTPGRLAELSRAGRLQTHNCPILVLDEVDQLLAPQFREEMTRLTQHVGKRVTPQRQTVIVSATLTPKVLTASQGWCPDPERMFVSVQQRQHAPSPGPGTGQERWGWDAAARTAVASSSAGGVGTSDMIPEMPPQLDHTFIMTNRRHRVDTLRRCIHALDAQRVLVFMNFQQRLQDTQAKLGASGMKVGALHGDMDKAQRQSTMAAFRRGDFRALIVSDVAARGLDFEKCDAVFNLELPSDAAHYAHRAGRTGRIGRQGTVVSLVETNERFVVDKLAKRLNVRIPEAEVAGGRYMLVPEGKLDWSEVRRGS